MQYFLYESTGQSINNKFSYKMHVLKITFLKYACAPTRTYVDINIYKPISAGAF